MWGYGCDCFAVYEKSRENCPQIQQIGQEMSVLVCLQHVKTRNKVSVVARRKLLTQAINPTA
jgi:hypothetical protein